MSQPGSLLRILGLGFGLAAVVGSVIGQGILRTPGIVAEATSSPVLIMGLWLAGGVLAIMTAFAFAELAAAIPCADGQFAHVERAFGKKVGLWTALSLLFAGITNVGLLSFVTGEFLVRLGVGGGSFSAVELGICATALFTLINATGTRASGLSQIFLSSIKGVVLIGLVVILFGAGPSAPAPTPVQNAELLRSGWLPLGAALLVVVSTYNGWWDLAFYGEEIRDPGKQVPRAMLGGILGVTTIYLLVNLAILRVMNPDEMAGSNFVAADAVGRVLGNQAGYFLTLFGVLSVGAIGNLGLMTNTRFVYALARASILPKSLGVVLPNGTPIFALLFGTVTASLSILTGSYMALASMTVSTMQAVVVLTVLSAMYLRLKEPELHRPFRIPVYPWSAIVALGFAVILMAVFVVQDPWYSLWGFVLITATWAVIQLLHYRRSRPVAV